MAATMAQPIAGVSASRETLIETVYPSVAANAVGRILGMLMDCIPVSILGVKLSHLLFAPIAAPIGAALYLLQKVTGNRYELTNRSLISRTSLGGQLIKQVPLADIADIEIETHAGYSFHNVGDVIAYDGRGEKLLVVPAVAWPARFRQIVLDARHARMESDSSLKQIESRG